MEVMTGLHENVNDQIFHPAAFPVSVYAARIIQQSRIMKVLMVLASRFILEYGPKYDFGTREFRGFGIYFCFTLYKIYPKSPLLCVWLLNCLLYTCQCIFTEHLHHLVHDYPIKNDKKMFFRERIFLFCEDVF